jgi:hypothetical protein
VDTTICNTFKSALATYSGPTVKINSLRRHTNKASAHYHGKAADFELSDNLVQWLLSSEGAQWIKDHNLMFYIEGKPGSKKVAKYLKGPTKEFVFFNPEATGDHIHLCVTNQKRV